MLILGGTLLVLVLLFALQPAPPKKPATEILPLVRTVPAEPGSHRPMVTLYGRLESPREASLAATINAFVDQVQVEEGQWVEPGQLLVQLDDSEVRLWFGKTIKGVGEEIYLGTITVSSSILHRKPFITSFLFFLL